MIHFQTRTYIHLFDECTQNWFAVASVLEHTLAVLKAAYPNLRDAFLRSDNAGCYHCAFLILSLPSLGKRAGISIARYDFSDPQAGKDVCDRRIATVKSHMRRYINEGHDIKSADDMKAAIESYGGVKGCQAAVVKAHESSQTMKKHTLTGIQALNNFRFESGGLRVWKAYDVGPGKYFPPDQLTRFGTPQGGPTNLGVLQPFGLPGEEAGSLRSMSREVVPIQPQPGTSWQPETPERPDDTRVCFSCPEAGCTKTYQSFASLQNHMDVGKHLVRLERETDYDTIKTKWAQACLAVSGSYLQREVPALSTDQEVAPIGNEHQLARGWALKTSRKATRFSEKVKAHLKRTFMEGEETGRKATAADVSSKMRTARDESGHKLFNRAEWLSADQISRYFSRLSALYRSGRLAVDESDPSPGQYDEQDFVAEAEEMITRLEIRRELEL